MRIKQSELIHFAMVFIFLTLNAGTIGADIVTVDDSGGANYTSIQDAVNNANNGDTILVYSGLYNENVYVDKELTIKSNSNNPSDTIVQATNSSDHVFNVTINNVTINGFNVTGATGHLKAGIYLYRVHGNIIRNNKLSNNYIGIGLESSSNNELSNNIVYSTEWCGIYLMDFSNNNTLSNNTVNLNNFLGIFLVKSKGNNLNDNIVSDNIEGIHISDNCYFSYFSCNNTLNNNTIFKNIRGIIISDCSNNKLSNNNAFDNLYGIIVGRSINNTLSNNNASNNKVYGISLYHSTNNEMSNNTVNRNKDHGIYLENSSDNELSNNIANSNIGKGIYQYLSKNNILHDNFMSNNSEELDLSTYIINRIDIDCNWNNYWYSNQYYISILEKKGEIICGHCIL